MSTSIRDQVIEALVTRLKTISQTNDYTCSPKDVVRAGLEALDKPLPLVVVWDRDEETEHRGGGFVQAMEIGIELFRPAETRNFSVIGNESLADIKRALFGDDPTLGGLVDNIAMEGSTIDFPSVEESVVKTVTVITIQYTEKRGDPYSAP